MMTKESAMQMNDNLRELAYYGLDDLKELCGYGKGIGVLKDDMASKGSPDKGWFQMITSHWEAIYNSVLGVIENHEKDHYESAFKEAKFEFLNILDTLIYTGDSGNRWPS